MTEPNQINRGLQLVEVSKPQSELGRNLFMTSGLGAVGLTVLIPTSVKKLNEAIKWSKEARYNEKTEAMRDLQNLVEGCKPSKKMTLIEQMYNPSIYCGSSYLDYLSLKSGAEGIGYGLLFILPLAYLLPKTLRSFVNWRRARETVQDLEERSMEN